MFDDKVLGEGITYDDVLLVPARSSILPGEVTTNSRISRNIEVNIPIISSPMDTVTEATLAIALAQEGGIGVIHKNLTPEKQGAEVQKVKRSANGVILDPVTLPPDAKLGHARDIMREYNISGIPVARNGRLEGILTHRDLKDKMTNLEQYAGLPPVSTKVESRRLKLAGHCTRHPEVEASKLVLWEPSQGKRNIGRRAVTYVDVLKRDTGLETTQDLRTAMMDRSGWRQCTALAQPGGRP